MEDDSMTQEQVTHNPSFIIEFNLVTKVMQEVDLMTFKIDPVDETKIYWVHCDRSQKGTLKYLREKLNLSTDVVELTKKTDRPSQILEHEDTLTLQMECLFHTKMLSAKESGNANLVMHLTDQYCLTITHGKIPVIDHLLTDLSSSIQFAKTPCFILFLMIDNLVAYYTDILYRYEIKAEDMDTMSGEFVYKEIVALKKRLMNVRRHTIILINILNYITSREIKAISKSCRTSLLILLSNAHTVNNESDSIRELLNSTLGQIDNALMRQVNNTMRVLTAIAAIFMPPSLIAAIYGMNFKNLPELNWYYGYEYALLLMLGSMIGMLYYFKRNKWY